MVKASLDRHRVGHKIVKSEDKGAGPIRGRRIGPQYKNPLFHQGAN